MDQPQERVEAPKPGTQFIRLADEKTFTFLESVQDQPEQWAWILEANNRSEQVAIGAKDLFGDSPNFRRSNWVKCTIPK